MADMFSVPTAFAVRNRKRRYNVSFDPDDVVRMDRLARHLGVSRSELLTFAFNRLYSDLLVKGEVK